MHDNMRGMGIKVEIGLCGVLPDHIAHTCILPTQQWHCPNIFDPVVIMEGYGQVTQGSKRRHWQSFLIIQGTFGDELGGVFLLNEFQVLLFDFLPKDLFFYFFNKIELVALVVGFWELFLVHDGFGGAYIFTQIVPL